MRFGSYLVLFSQEESALAIVSGAEGGEQSLDRLDSLPQSWHLAGRVLPSDSFRSLLSAPSVTRPDLPLCPAGPYQLQKQFRHPQPVPLCPSAMLLADFHLRLSVRTAQSSPTLLDPNQLEAVPVCVSFIRFSRGSLTDLSHAPEAPQLTSSVSLSISARACVRIPSGCFFTRQVCKQCRPRDPASEGSGW